MVGAIPPGMGGTAATGSLEAGKVLFSCQFPPFQRPELRTLHRLLWRLSHDVGHPPGPVQVHCPAPQPGLDRTVRGGPCPGCQHMDLPLHLSPHQPLYFLPRLSVLHGCRPEELRKLLFRSLLHLPLVPLFLLTGTKWPPGERCQGRASELKSHGHMGKKQKQNIQGGAQFLPSLCC